MAEFSGAAVDFSVKDCSERDGSVFKYFVALLSAVSYKASEGADLSGEKSFARVMDVAVRKIMQVKIKSKHFWNPCVVFFLGECTSISEVCLSILIALFRL